MHLFGLLLLTASGYAFDPTTSEVAAADDFEPMVEEDVAMPDFVAQQRARPPAPTHLFVDSAGVEPLSDAYPLYVVATNEQLVAAELPVLVAVDPVAFAAAHPEGLLIVAEFTSGSHHQVVQQLVTRDTLVAGAPTFAFLQAALPAPESSGNVEVRVAVGAPSGPATSRFARSTVYSR